MRIKSKLFTLLILLFINSTLWANSYSSYIVKLKDSKTSISLLNKNYNIQTALPKSIDSKIADSDLNDYYIIKKDASINEADFLNELKSSNLIESVEPNYIFSIDELDVPNDPEYSEQWSLETINALKAWEKSTGEGVIVGVVDTGIDYDHQDITEQLLYNEKEDLNNNGHFEPWSYMDTLYGLSGDFNGIDDDGNGYIDDVVGYDFVDQTQQGVGDYFDADSDPYDEHSHGTSVSGIIAAKTNNGVGIAGIAYNSKILTARAFDVFGNGEVDDMAASIIYCAINGAKVINMSFGERIDSPYFLSAIKFANSMGCVLVSSSGNDYYNDKHYPSDYNEVISVGNSNIENIRTGSSNYGSQLDLMAPGTQIKTLSFSGTYKLFSGTSAAAPHVSAAAALLLSLKPDLTPEEVKGIICSSCFDVDEDGWDEKTAAGILDLEKMLNTQSPSRIEITSPENDIHINRDEIDLLEIKGYALHPLFEKYQILSGIGRTPDKWRVSHESSNQINGNILGVINPEIFIDTIVYWNSERTQIVKQEIVKDSLFTIAVKVFLKNNKTLEDRIFVDVYSNDSKLEFHHTSATNIYDDSENKIDICATTNRVSNLAIKYVATGTTDTITRYDNYDLTTQHKLLLEDLTPGIEYTAYILAYHNEFDTVSAPIKFTLKDAHFETENLYLKNAISNRLWLCPDVTGENGEYTVYSNNFNRLDTEEPLVWTYSNGQFTLTDSNDTNMSEWIVKSTGDINGNGKTDVLAITNGRSIVFEQHEGQSLFDNTIYNSPPFQTTWANDLFDIDNDGIDEIIAHNDTAYIVIDFINNEYITTAITIIPEEFAHRKLSNNIAIGDLDNDNKYEICFANDYGNVFIYEYENKAFKLEYIDSTYKTASNNYFTSGDTDGDGIAEIHFLKLETVSQFGLLDGYFPVWAYRVLESKTPDTYEYTDIKFINGGREDQPSIFKNGIVCGDVNNDSIDEVILSTFPNLYIFSYDQEDKEYSPMWTYPSALSNSVIVHDFDGNGIKEVGFSAFNACLFYEYVSNDTKLGVPTNPKVEILSNDQAIISWDPVVDAQYYQIGFFEDNLVELYPVNINATQIQVTKPEANKDDYVVTVRAVNENYEDKFSGFCDLLDMKYHDLIDDAEISIIQNKPLQLDVLFNGLLDRNYILLSYFTLSSDDIDDVHPVSVLVSKNNTAVLAFDKSYPSGTYTLSIDSFWDKYNGKSKTLSIEFNINNEEVQEELYLVKLRKDASVLYQLYFSENIDPVTAIDINNYSLHPFGEVTSVGILENDPTSVQIILSSWLSSSVSRGIEFTITTKDILAQSGNLLTTGPGNSLSFVLAEEKNTQAYAYPQPFSLLKDEQLTFAGLTPYAEIQIVSLLDGEILATLIENDGNGGYQWDLRDKNGNIITPGVYLFRITGKNHAGEEVFEEIKKFIVKP